MGTLPAWRKGDPAVANRIHPPLTVGRAAISVSPFAPGRLAGEGKPTDAQSMGAMVQLPENCTPLSMNTSGACNVPDTRAGT